VNGESSGLKIICSFAYETRKEVMRVNNVGSSVRFLEVNILQWLCNEMKMRPVLVNMSRVNCRLILLSMKLCM